MVHCPECGKEQPDEMKFCRHCGDRLPGGSEVRRLREEAAAIAQARGTPVQGADRPTGDQAPSFGPAPQADPTTQGQHHSPAGGQQGAGPTSGTAAGTPFQTGQPLRRR